MMRLNLTIVNNSGYETPPQNEIKEAILEILREKKTDGNFEVDIKFVSKDEIHELNKAYRQIDKPTDVLSFPVYKKIPLDAPAPILLGDIIIAPEMAELPILELIKHSTLHLLGFHHPGD